MLELDSQKLKYHPKRVSDWLDRKKIYPLYVEVSLTNRCNHNCSFCAVSFAQHTKVDLDTDIIKNTISDMSAVGVKSIMFGGEGEPLLHKDFVDIVKHAKSCGIEVALTTNGVLFNKNIADRILPLLSWIKFSVDSGDFKTYANLHGTKEFDYKKVLDNISYCSFIKRLKKFNIVIGVQSILLKSNIENMWKLGRTLSFIKPDYFVVKPFSVHWKSGNNELEHPTEEQIDKFKKDMESYKNKYEFIYRDVAFSNVDKNKQYKDCYGKDFMGYIDSYGGVYSCINYIGDDTFCYGNIHKDSFSNIWKNKKEIYPNLSDCRTICRLDNVNRYLERITHPEDGDNFI